MKGSDLGIGKWMQESGDKKMIWELKLGGKKGEKMEQKQ